MTFALSVLMGQAEILEGKLEKAETLMENARKAPTESMREHNLNYIGILKRTTEKQLAEVKRAIAQLEDMELAEDLAKTINGAFESILGKDLFRGLTKRS